MPGSAGPEERVHFVEEDHHRHVVSRLFLGFLKDLRGSSARLADVLVQQLRTLHVEEVRGHFLAASVRDLLGQATATALAIIVLPHPGGP